MPRWPSGMEDKVAAPYRSVPVTTVILALALVQALGLAQVLGYVRLLTESEVN